MRTSAFYFLPTTFSWQMRNITTQCWKANTEDEATRETQAEHKKEADSRKRSALSREQHRYTEP